MLAKRSMLLRFLLIISALIFFVSSAYAVAKLPFSQGDGSITLYNYHTGEVLNVNYRAGQKYNKRAIKKIRHIFRSRSDDLEHDIDLKLIELLDNVQDHFKADAIELISGYRSPELNKQLKAEGQNVAEESLHMGGQAADIHIDEVAEGAIVDYVRSLKVGGVGYYPAWNFVHIDTGEMRNWNLPDKPGRELLGFQKGSEWQILTDKNIYKAKAQVRFRVTNTSNEKRTFADDIELRIFRKGEWKILRVLNSCKGKSIGAGQICSGRIISEANDPFGKYILSIPADNANSNEFYLKAR